jgi:hypothetical protein
VERSKKAPATTVGVRFMKNSWFSILTVVVLLGLLALLATLQYNWLGQISDGERERLQKRLSTETERFAEDFNREIQNAYFTFQTDASLWREKNYSAFALRHESWKAQTAHPNCRKVFKTILRTSQTGSIRSMRKTLLSGFRFTTESKKSFFDRHKG